VKGDNGTSFSYAKTIAGFVSLLVLITLFFGAYRFLDDRYALANELAKVEKRLDVKIADDQRISMQQEMRQIEERNLGRLIEKWDQRDRLRYMDLKDQLGRILDKLKMLQ
jgi:hypothetical protein